MLPETPHQFFARCWALCFQRTSNTATCGDAPVSFSPARDEPKRDSVSAQPGPSPRQRSFLAEIGVEKGLRRAWLSQACCLQ